MNRLSQVNLQFANKPAVSDAAEKKIPKLKPVTDVWESMGMDAHMSARAVKMRKETGQMMDSIYNDLLPYIERTDFPDWLPSKFKPLGVNGLQIKGYGSQGVTTLEAGAIVYEICKRDASVGTFLLVHNGIGMAVIDALGDEEQKERLLPKGISFEKIFSFGLTEPLNGSDASGL